MDFTTIFLSFAIGLLGFAMFSSGRKAGRLVPIASGVGLMIVPSVLPGVTITLIVSAVLTALPWVIRD